MRRFTLVAILLALTACGGNARDVEGGDALVNWENPIAGVAVSSVGEAQPFLPFPILTPKGLGSPTTIFVTPPQILPSDAVVAFVYDTDSYGRVVVQEHLPDVPVDQYDAANQRLAADNGNPNLHGSFAIVPIRRGIQALVTTAEGTGVSDIFWLEQGTFEVVVRGPSLTLAQVLAIANSL